MDQGSPQGPVCRCPHHSVFPVAVLLIGLLFLLQALYVVSMRFVELAWPILLMVGALSKLFGRCRCCSWRGW